MLKKVLIVEDEPLVALDLEEVIRGAGYDVVGPASDEHEAVALLEKKGIDLVVLDANLNGNSARPIAERLQSIRIPFVAVSGYARSQISEWIGDAPFLGKPYSAERLVSVISELAAAGR